MLELGEREQAGKRRVEAGVQESVCACGVWSLGDHGESQGGQEDGCPPRGEDKHPLAV